MNFGNVTGAGYSTISPFHAEAIMHNIGHGFEYLGMITVVTDVVRENNQSYRLGWSEMAKDGSKMGVGSPEYVLIFRKPQSDRTRGYADVPVAHVKDDYSRARWQIDAHAFWRSSGDRPLTAEDMRGMPPGARMHPRSARPLPRGRRVVGLGGRGGVAGAPRPVVRRWLEAAPLPAVSLSVPRQVDARAAHNWDEAH